MKKALLFGLNYLNDSSSALGGCINDAKNLKNLLVTRLGYQPEDVLLCTDETEVKPTRAIMLRLLRELVIATHRSRLDQIFISYSGHGTSYQDASGDEEDGMDECLVPLDYRTAGVIKDDDLGKILRKVHHRTDIVMLVDACHSGTIVDFPYRYVSGNKFVMESPSVAPVGARAVVISGCQDNQLSQEVWSIDDDKKITGIMTSAFIQALTKHDYDITCWKLIKYMQDFITEYGYQQKPQMSSSRKLTETCIFCTDSTNVKPFMVRSGES